MSEDKDFEQRLTELRPKLHRYCARMTGSSVDGEDVVQETLIKAVAARQNTREIDNVEGWLFRIAHNASIDFLRARVRDNVVSIAEDIPGADAPDPHVTSASFRTFLDLPVLPRCAVILRDVLGHSLEEIAAISGCSVPAAKSALQRGRHRLKGLIAAGEDGARLPVMSDDDRQRLQRFIALFRAGDFEAIRDMLAADVRLDLVNRLKWQGQKEILPYFARYAEITHWRFMLGGADGRPAILVYDARGDMARPSHFIVLTWSDAVVAEIRDFLYAPYAMEAVDWLRLD